MKKFLLTMALVGLSPVAHGQYVAATLAAQQHGSPPVRSQSCMTNASSTSVSCATSSAVPSQNFTAGQQVVALGYSGIGNLNSVPTGSGAGCPSSWTNIGTGTDGSDGFAWAVGTAQAGACTITYTETGSSTGMWITWWAVSGGTAHVDGTGAFLQTNLGAGTSTGASYTTTHSGDLILGAVVENKLTGDSTFAAIAPFSSASPGQINTNLGVQGWPQMAVFASQASAGTTTITWTQGVSSVAWSFVLGVY